jgi:hypothetical protein
MPREAGSQPKQLLFRLRIEKLSGGESKVNSADRLRYSHEVATPSKVPWLMLVLG